MFTILKITYCASCLIHVHADDGNPCTLDVCDTAGCQHVDITPTECDDGRSCTIDSCESRDDGNVVCLNEEYACLADGSRPPQLLDRFIRANLVREMYRADIYSIYAIITRINSSVYHKKNKREH